MARYIKDAQFYNKLASHLSKNMSTSTINVPRSGNPQFWIVADMDETLISKRTRNIPESPCFPWLTKWLQEGHGLLVNTSDDGRRPFRIWKQLHDHLVQSSQNSLYRLDQILFSTGEGAALWRMEDQQQRHHCVYEGGEIRFVAYPGYERSMVAKCWQEKREVLEFGKQMWVDFVKSSIVPPNSLNNVITPESSYGEEYRQIVIDLYTQLMAPTEDNSPLIDSVTLDDLSLDRRESSFTNHKAQFFDKENQMIVNGVTKEKIRKLVSQLHGPILWMNQSGDVDQHWRDDPFEPEAEWTNMFVMNCPRQLNTMVVERSNAKLKNTNSDRGNCLIASDAPRSICIRRALSTKDRPVRFLMKHQLINRGFMFGDNPDGNDKQLKELGDEYQEELPFYAVQNAEHTSTFLKTIIEEILGCR